MQRKDFEPDPRLTLDMVFDDLQAIKSDWLLTKRIEKRRAKQPPDLNAKYETLLHWAWFLGWNDRALIAAKLDEELGHEKMASMRVNDFMELVFERCEKEGIEVPEHLDPFEAIEAWHTNCKNRMRRAKK
jgi:hypothetical protein